MRWRNHEHSLFQHFIFNALTTQIEFLSISNLQLQLTRNEQLCLQNDTFFDTKILQKLQKEEGTTIGNEITPHLGFRIEGHFP